MAINKVVNKKTMSHGAMRNVISYVLRSDKVKEGYVDITGPYEHEVIDWDHVYRAFLHEKRLWDKDSGRMYTHNIISFHKDEKITPAQVLEIGRRFAQEFFPDHQCLIGVHQDRDHLHCHILTNSVSYIDGRKLHQTKKDLEKQKTFTNNLCQEQGFTITEKGKHFDGMDIEVGHVTAWSKDKYNLAINASKKPFLVDCMTAIEEVRKVAKNIEDFVAKMLEKGWTVTWTEKKKHITFQNVSGNKVRDSNLSKTFNVDVSKESLEKDFLRNTGTKNKSRSSLRARLNSAKKEVEEEKKLARLKSQDSIMEQRCRKRSRLER